MPVMINVHSRAAEAANAVAKKEPCDNHMKCLAAGWLVLKRTNKVSV